jgi:hypothetical protein
MLSIYKKNREKELNAALLTYSSKRERKIEAQSLLGN